MAVLVYRGPRLGVSTGGWCRPEGSAEPYRGVSFVCLGKPAALTPSATQVVGEGDRLHAVADLGVDGFHRFESRGGMRPEPFLVFGVVGQPGESRLAWRRRCPDRSSLESVPAGRPTGRGVR